MLAGPYSSGLAVGVDGSALVNADTPTRLTGYVKAIHVKYQGATPPSTTDVVITTKGTYPAPPTITLLTLTNKNTDGRFPVRTLPVDAVGVALAALTIAEPIYIDDVVNISVAQANNVNYVEYWLVMDEGY